MDLLQTDKFGQYLFVDVVLKLVAYKFYFILVCQWLKVYMDSSEYKVNLGCDLFRVFHYNFQSSLKIFHGFVITLFQQNLVRDVIETFLV